MLPSIVCDFPASMKIDDENCSKESSQPNLCILNVKKETLDDIDDDLDHIILKQRLTRY